MWTLLRVWNGDYPAELGRGCVEPFEAEADEELLEVLPDVVESLELLAAERFSDLLSARESVR